MSSKKETHSAEQADYNLSLLIGDGGSAELRKEKLVYTSFFNSTKDQINPTNILHDCCSVINGLDVICELIDSDESCSDPVTYRLERIYIGLGDEVFANVDLKWYSNSSAHEIHFKDFREELLNFEFGADQLGFALEYLLRVIDDYYQETVLAGESIVEIRYLEVNSPFRGQSFWSKVFIEYLKFRYFKSNCKWYLFEPRPAEYYGLNVSRLPEKNIDHYEKRLKAFKRYLSYKLGAASIGETNLMFKKF